MAANASNPYRIRSFQSKDRKACRRLYTQELLGTCLAPNDTGWDMDNIDEVYMRKPQNHFWVAVTDKDEVVGMLGVQHHEAGVGEVRRLRVVAAHRRKSLVVSLLETALRFCQQRGDVKVTLDTVMDKEIAMPLFEKFHFRYHSSKQVGEKELLYFYVDLYSSERKANDIRK